MFRGAAEGELPGPEHIGKTKPHPRVTRPSLTTHCPAASSGVENAKPGPDCGGRSAGAGQPAELSENVVGVPLSWLCTSRAPAARGQMPTPEASTARAERVRSLWRRYPIANGNGPGAADSLDPECPRTPLNQLKAGVCPTVSAAAVRHNFVTAYFFIPAPAGFLVESRPAPRPSPIFFANSERCSA